MIKPLSKKRIIIASLLLLIFVLIIFSQFLYKTYSVDIKNGTVDFSSADDSKVYRFNGDWKFYWKKFVHREIDEPSSYFELSPEKYWIQYSDKYSEIEGRGYGTYKIILNNLVEGDLYGFYLPSLGTSYELWVNNKLVESEGKIGKNLKEETPRAKYKTAYFTAENSVQTIYLKLSNFYYKSGGSKDKIYFGKYSAIQKYFFIKTFMQVLIIGSVVIFFLYHLMAFIMLREEYSYLFFSLICFVMFIRLLVTNGNVLLWLFESVSWDSVIRLSYMTVFGLISTFLLFFHSLYQNEFSDKITKGFVILNTAFLCYTMFSSIYYFTKILPYLMYIEIFIGFYVTFNLIRAFKFKRDASLNALLGFMILYVFSIHDVFIVNNLIQSVPLVPIGMFLFLFFQASILSVKYSKALKTTENLYNSMKELDLIKDEFMKNTSYQLQEPLYSIIDLTDDLLIQKKDLELDVKEVIDLVNQSSKNLATRVNELLDFSALKHKNLYLNKVPVDLNIIISIAINEIKSSNYFTNFRIINNIKEEIPLILADKNRIHQIIYTLIDTMTKFSQSGDIIVNEDVQTNYVSLKIIGNGVNISNTILQGIFNPFSLRDWSIPKTFHGTGLSLNIIKKIIELHEGKMDIVTSQSNKTEFIISFPISKDIDVFTYKQVGERSNSERYYFNNEKSSENIERNNKDNVFTILVIDDDPISAHLISNMLSNRSYNLLYASKVNEALDIIDSNQTLDLVILESVMPTMSGSDICRFIRKKYSLYELPVIMLTAKNQKSLLISSFEAGVNDFLTKPYDREELRARIRTLVNLKNITNSNEVLNKAINLKNDFIDLVTHDLKTPLSILIGYSQVLKTKIKNEDHFLEEIASAIYSSSLSMNTMIEDLLESARIENGNVSLTYEKFNFYEYLITNIKDMKLLASKKKQKIRFSCEDKKIIVRLDKKRLLEIIENIVTNAIKYSPEESEISVLVEKEHTKGFNNFVKIIIKDQGPGFTKEDMDKIFVKYQKLSAKPTGSEQSTGLGLYISKKLTDLMSGSISVINNENKGASFVLKFPLQN